MNFFYQKNRSGWFQIKSLLVSIQYLALPIPAHGVGKAVTE